MIKIAIVGSRDYLDLNKVVDFIYQLKNLGTEITIVSGGARGVDQAAENAAKANGFSVLSFKPDWKNLGKKAGLLRNSDIVDSCDYLVAFWDGNSNGTKDSITKAKAANKLLAIILPDEPLPEINLS